MQDEWFYKAGQSWKGPATRSQLMALVKDHIVSANAAVVSKAGTKSRVEQILQERPDLPDQPARIEAPLPPPPLPSSSAAKESAPQLTAAVTAPVARSPATATKANAPDARGASAIHTTAKMIFTLVGVIVMGSGLWWYLHSDSPNLPSKADRWKLFYSVVRVVEAIKFHHAE